MPIINQVVAGGGTTPTGTISITSNGTHDVTNYATADVNVPTTAPASYRVFEVDLNSVLSHSKSTAWIPLPNNARDVDAYIFAYAYSGTPANILSGNIDLSKIDQLVKTYSFLSCFSGCVGITSVDMSGVWRITGGNTCFNMFYDCSSLTSFNLNALKTIDGQNSCRGMFANTGITVANLPLLETVAGQASSQEMFKSCQSLTSFDLSSLTQVQTTNGCSSMFQDCTGLTSVDLSALTLVSGGNACSNMFQGCGNLTSLSFPSITPKSFGTRVNQFSNMCQGIPSITLHFPSNAQAKVETLSGFSTTAPFGATSGTVLFDLPATYTLTGADSVTYTRNPKYDTATSLAWKVGAYSTTNFTPAYYTSGTTDPAVSDAIYSDAACTQSVTTITAIA